MELKLEYTKMLIHCWVESWGVENVYVAYSGGKDSEVLLHIARELYPEIKAVFSNTGLEFPEIVKHVKKHANVTVLRPKLPFHKVIERWGWPVINKEVAKAISRYRNTKRQDQRDYRLNGKIVNGKRVTVGTIPKKWQFMIHAPFKISDMCCTQLKKNPFKKYERETGGKPMIGIMGGDSNARKIDIKNRGCNVYDAKAPQSRPLANWDDRDIYDYIDKFGVKICEVYAMGHERTGCAFCLFGADQESKKTGTNKYEKMKLTHPKLYDYCINKLGAGEVMDFIGIPY